MEKTENCWRKLKAENNEQHVCLEGIGKGEINYSEHQFQLQEEKG